MDRREFLKTSMVVSLSCLFPGASGWAYSPGGAKGIGSKKLIVIFLRGAADGLNIVVPYADSQYYSGRPTIAIPPPGKSGGCLDLDGTFGLHPVLAPLHSHWKNKSLAFVNCSGSPEPTRSHFDAQDYMESGRPGVKVVSSGWLNRVLQELPNTNSPIRAINVGATLPRILQGPVSTATYAPKRGKRKSVIDIPVIASAFSQMYTGRKDALGEAYEEGIEAHHTLKEKLEKEMVAANKGAPTARNFRGFGRQLGSLFGKDESTQVAFLALGGWDTHVNQGASKGQLANHLKVLGEGLNDLIHGLGSQYKDTVIMVMSEFGRTAKENGNGGTDHGHGNVMMVLGGGINGGKVYGQWQGLDKQNLFEGRDLPVITDFRDIVGVVSQNHMKLSNKALSEIFPDYNFKPNSYAKDIIA